MKALLDTEVLLELPNPNGNTKLKQAVGSMPDEWMFISVITLGEISKAIELLPEIKKKWELSEWLLSILSAYHQRILPVTQDIAMMWGEFAANAQAKGQILPAADGILAATAVTHGLHLFTNRVKTFQDCGVMLLNPWEM